MELGGPAATAAAKRGVTPCIWAVGGGKGGVGKSVVTSSLAIAFASRGQSCVLIDTDLGGANLHTLLGIRAPRQTLTHFLTGEVKQLEDIACPGPVPNLRLISGAQALLEMANPSHSRKEKLLRQIQRLDVDHVFLDLGAGSAFNVLDFFVTASRGILVVVPEPTSIENAYHFLKAAFFRSLRQAVQRAGVREVMQEALRERSQRLGSPRELIARMQELDPSCGTLLAQQAREFRPLLIVNQAQTQEHRRVGADMAIACREYLGTELRDLGALARDECVRAAVSERVPVLKRFPGSVFARDLEQLVKRLAAGAEPAGMETPEHATCEFRPGRQRYGRIALAASGLADALPGDAGLAAEESPAESQSEQLLRVVEHAVEAAPELTAPLERSVEALPALDFSSPGQTLRRWREARGLALEELSARLRIMCLGAIERERFEAVPPEPFIRGFVKAYAEALGIASADALAAAFIGRYRAAALQLRLRAQRGIPAA